MNEPITGTNTAPTTSLEERLAAVMVKEAEAEKKKAADDAERTLAYFELKHRLTDELGVQGRDFQIISTVEGLVAVKRVDQIIMKQWDDACARCAKAGTATTTAMCLALSMHGVVYPEPAAYKAMVLGTKERPGADGIAGLAANAIQRLHGNVELEVQGKR